MRNKFRVWDKEQNKWVSVNIVIANDGLAMWQFGFGIDFIDDQDRYVVQFWTGLKDKNGKEIYDGDILKHDLWGITFVMWEHGMFRAHRSNENDPKNYIDVTLADHQLARTKVIGNICENPELMKGGDHEPTH